MDRNEHEALMVAEYRKRAAERLAQRRAQRQPAASTSTASNGIVTLHFALDAKPISDLGGPVKVFGPSRIRIPK